MTRPQMAKQHLVTAELCMGDIVNCRVARKRTRIHATAREVAADWLAFGRSRIHRAAIQSQREQARKSLDSTGSK
jgi:hypothetical protein